MNFMIYIHTSLSSFPHESLCAIKCWESQLRCTFYAYLVSSDLCRLGDIEVVVDGGAVASSEEHVVALQTGKYTV